nr:hypothetical protein [Tissierella sp.]
MIKFTMSNFEITIPKDINKLEKQIETLRDQIKIMRRQIEFSRGSDEMISGKRTFIEVNLSIHEEALECSKNAYNNRLVI